MKNNQGFTLVELLVSIVLISGILFFLVNLIDSLINEPNNNGFANKNQLNRIELIRLIENDLNDYTLINLEDNSNNDNLIITFYFKDGMSILESSKNANKNHLKYTNYKNEEYNYEMVGAVK